MVLVDYIGIYFTFPNTFDRWLYTFSLNIYTFFLSLYWILFSCLEKKYTSSVHDSSKGYRNENHVTRGFTSDAINEFAFRLQGTQIDISGYWFILRFCEHFTCLSSKIQNAIKLENISNLITSPSSNQCIRRKTRLEYFLIHGRHISMECMRLCAYCHWISKFSKQMVRKYLATEYIFIT